MPDQDKSSCNIEYSFPPLCHTHQEFGAALCDRGARKLRKLLAEVHAVHPQPEICEACKVLGRK